MRTVDVLPLGDGTNLHPGSHGNRRPGANARPHSRPAGQVYLIVVDKNDGSYSSSRAPSRRLMASISREILTNAKRTIRPHNSDAAETISSINASSPPSAPSALCRSQP